MDKIKTVVEKNDNNSISLIGKLSSEEINPIKDLVLKELQKGKKMKGFREGNVPADVIEKELGSIEIWKQAAHDKIMDEFPSMLIEHNLVIIGSPVLQFLSIVDKGDVEFKVTFYTMPEIKLPDYKDDLKKIEKPTEEQNASKEEIEQVLTDLKKALFKQKNPTEEIPSDVTKLPELDDEFIKNVSGKYDNVKDLEKSIEESIKREKVLQAKGEHRLKIINTIIDKTDVDIPEIVVLEEGSRAFEDLKQRVKNFGTTMEDYIKSQNTTEEKIREDLNKEAKNRIIAQLIMSAVAKEENVSIPEEELNKEIERFSGRETGMTKEQVKLYLETVLTNERVLNHLESVSGK